jgi:hypothetical protein
MIRHPETGAAWWAPGPLAFEHVLPTKRPDESQADRDTGRDKIAAPAAEPVSASAPDSSDTTTGSARLRRSPITSYTLSRKSLVDMVGGRNKKYLSLLTAIRSGMAVAPDSRDAVWREDMGGLLLGMMRKHVTDALIARGNRPHGPRDKFIQSCVNWKDVEGVRMRGCVIWLPENSDGPRQYATLDVEGAQYGRKMVVHNLRWLLGDEEVQRLRDSAEVFREGEIFVLKQWASRSVMRLHLLLWKLQGYLAEPDTGSSTKR